MSLLSIISYFPLFLCSRKTKNIFWVSFHIMINRKCKLEKKLFYQIKPRGKCFCCRTLLNVFVNIIVKYFLRIHNWKNVTDKNFHLFWLWPKKGDVALLYSCRKENPISVLNKKTQFITQFQKSLGIKGHETMPLLTLDKCFSELGAKPLPSLFSIEWDLPGMENTHSKMLYVLMWSVILTTLP